MPSSMIAAAASAARWGQTPAGLGIRASSDGGERGGSVESIMPINVCPATAEDLPALRRLFLTSRRKAFFWQSPDAFHLQDFDSQTQGELVLVAKDGDALPAGFISLWQPDDFIHHLYVDPTCLRRGIGRALLHALPNWPATRYRLKCVRRNEAALAFYRACRFLEVDSGIAEDGEYLLLESSGALE